MTKAIFSRGLIILWALRIGACVGAFEGEPAPANPDTKAPEAPDTELAGTDGGEATEEPGSPVEAPEAEVAMDPQALEASCLTFYTPDEGLGSRFEEGLQAAIVGPKLVYLNRAGGTYTRGRNDSSNNVSSIPNRAVSVAPYEGSNTDWQSVVSCVKAQFSDYNVSITDQDPGAATHIEAVVGDGPASLDLASGVGGISPFSCGLIDRSIVFVFSRVLRSVQSECEVIAHEIGHSIGLEHEFLCQDPMTYLSGCGAKTFQDRAASCGTSRAVDCECGSRTQNTVQKLLANVGPRGTGTPEPPPPTPPADEKPQVRVITPGDGAMLPANSEIVIAVEASDDRALDDVRLLWEFQGARMLSCKNAVAPVTCSAKGNLFTFRFPVGVGSRAFVAEAIDSAQQSSKSARISLTLNDTTTVDAVPVVSLTQPTRGMSLRAGSRFAVRVTAVDDGSVRQVNLVWQSPTSSQTIRLQKLSADTYGADLTLSTQSVPGPRTLTANALDDAGQTGTSAPVTITLTR